MEGQRFFDLTRWDNGIRNGNGAGAEWFCYR